MEMEISRQLVHFSGFLFVILAQYLGGFIIAIYCFFIAATLFAYSELIKREQKKLYGIIDIVENRIRDVIKKFETREVRRPFIGAVWFFVGIGISFLVFPMQPVNIASAVGLILTVGDSLSTIVGIRLGKHRIIGKKTWEGSVVFFAAAFLVSLIFLNPGLSFTAALTATIAELIPELNIISRHKKAGRIDDNFLIPVLTGLVLMLLVL